MIKKSSWVTDFLILSFLFEVRTIVLFFHFYPYYVFDYVIIPKLARVRKKRDRCQPLDHVFIVSYQCF